MEGDAGSGSAGVGPDQNSCVKVLVIAFNEMWGEKWDAKGWYTSTKELQLASVELCKVCRTYQTLHLNVEAGTPRRLLSATDTPPLHPKRPCGTRLPRLRARSVTWNMPTAGELRNPIVAMTDSDRLVFGRGFQGNLEAVSWPQRLKTIDMRDSTFNKPLERIRFPASLETIVLSERFNQPIDRVEFPASLLQLIFCVGSSFNQPITGGFLPTSLEEINFGEQFNQRIEDMVWPPSLLKLHLGYEFDQPIERVVFPPSLQELTVEGSFNQPIEGVSWPDSLQRLAFGFSFNRSIDNVRWPSSLQEITFASCGDHAGSTVTVYADFNQSIGRSVWPASLRRLTLGEHFRQSLHGLGTWIPNLEALRLLDHKDGSGTEESLLRGIEWPMALRHLTVIKGSNLDGVTIPSLVQVDFVKHVL